MIWNFQGPERNRWAKGVVLLTFLVRLVSTAGFGFYGVKFLARTDNLKDFILNCVALQFVFEIPTIAYQAFSLVQTQQQLRRLNRKWDDAAVKGRIPVLFGFL